ncbi:hypothetical protein [Nocardia brasiliensis]|uniref:hypothetical protein n=1 Tax=Nocardia brasiliensis TaxID=37326 RepID=UPI0024539D50|nr:hypothetical protein [Nocardia brasiliensis]
MTDPVSTPTADPPRAADGTPLWTPTTQQNGITFTQPQTPPPSAATTPQAPPATTGATPQPPPAGQQNLPIDPTQGSPTRSADNVPIPPLSVPALDPSKLAAGGTLPADGLKNGDYSLKMVDGNLVLSGADGRIWESATNGPGGSLSFRSDGSFDISVSGPYGGYSIWQNGLKLSNVGSLYLTDKGKLVILDKNGKEIHTIAAPDGIKHYAVVSLHIPAGAPEWLISLIETIDAWFQRRYDLLGAGKPGETDDLFKMMSNQGLLDPRKERNTGKLVEQYSKNNDYIVGVKNQLQQGNTQIQVLSLSQIPEKIGETRTKLDRIVAELNDKLRHADPEAVVTGKEMKAAATAAAVDALYQAVGRAEKVLKAASDFITAKQKEVVDKVPGSNLVGAPGIGNGNGIAPITDFSGAPTPSTDMSPLFDDLLSGDGPTKPDAPGGLDLDALLKDLEGDSAPGAGSPNGNGSASAAPSPGTNPLAGVMGLLPLLPVVAQMMSQMRPPNNEQKRPVDPTSPVDPSQPPPDPDTPAPTPVTYTDAPPSSVSAATPPPPPAGKKSWVDMKVENVQQKVPEAVARAVNKEFNDPSGIDARDAYAGTSGQSTEDKPWKQVDSSNVKTGDVVQWTNTATGEALSGIVVRNGDELQLVTHDKLIALDLKNPPATGSGPYEFVGFFHPTGVDGDAAPATTPPAPPAVKTAAPPAPPPSSAPAATPPPRT